MTGWGYTEIGAMNLPDLAFWAEQAMAYSRQQAAAISEAGMA